jgi:hypothetical protein
VSSDLAVNPSVISNVALHTSNRIEENSEKGLSANLPHDAVVSFPGKQGAHTKGTMGLDSPGSAEVTRHEQAATKAQAAFRGYLVMLYCMKHKRNVIIVTYMNRRFEVNSAILSSTHLSGSLMCFMPHLLDAWCTLLIIYWGFQYNFLFSSGCF